MENEGLENKVNGTSTKLSFLIADDKEEIRTFIKMVLNKHYSLSNIKEARSGKELLENATQTNYNLIITDNDMEKMDVGVETVKALRGRNILTPVIIMSGRDSDKINDYLNMTAGQDNISFLPKPIPSIPLFLSEINKYLKRE